MADPSQMFPNLQSTPSQPSPESTNLNTQAAQQVQNVDPQQFLQAGLNDSAVRYNAYTQMMQHPLAQVIANSDAVQAIASAQGLRVPKSQEMLDLKNQWLSKSQEKQQAEQDVIAASTKNHPGQRAAAFGLGLIGLGPAYVAMARAKNLSPSSQHYQSVMTQLGDLADKYTRGTKDEQNSIESLIKANSSYDDVTKMMSSTNTALDGILSAGRPIAEFMLQQPNRDQALKTSRQNEINAKAQGDLADWNRTHNKQQVQLTGEELRNKETGLQIKKTEQDLAKGPKQELTPAQHIQIHQLDGKLNDARAEHKTALGRYNGLLSVIQATKAPKTQQEIDDLAAKKTQLATFKEQMDHSDDTIKTYEHMQNAIVTPIHGKSGSLVKPQSVGEVKGGMTDDQGNPLTFSNGGSLSQPPAPTADPNIELQRLVKIARANPDSPEGKSAAQRYMQLKQMASDGEKKNSSSIDSNPLDSKNIIARAEEDLKKDPDGSGWAKAGWQQQALREGALTPQQQKAYTKWHNENGIGNDSEYNMPAFFKKYVYGKTEKQWRATTSFNPADKSMHFTDEFKLPNARTASKFSNYVDKQKGANWGYLNKKTGKWEIGIDEPQGAAMKNYKYAAAILPNGKLIGLEDWDNGTGIKVYRGSEKPNLKDIK